LPKLPHKTNQSSLSSHLHFIIKLLKHNQPPKSPHRQKHSQTPVIPNAIFCKFTPQDPKIFCARHNKTLSPLLSSPQYKTPKKKQVKSGDNLGFKAAQNKAT
jgi:hypothetical protein